MTMPNFIQPGSLLYQEETGEKYAFCNADPNDMRLLWFTTPKSKELVAFSVDEIFLDPESSLKIFRTNDDLMEYITGSIDDQTGKYVTANIWTAARAREIVDKYLAVERAVGEAKAAFYAEQEAEIKTRGKHRSKRFKLTPVLLAACSAHDISKTTYYEYKNIYRKHQGDVDAIAASLLRSSKGQTKFDGNTIHFVDTLIMRYFVRIGEQITRRTLINIIRENYKKLGGMWIDLEIVPISPSNGKKSIQPIEDLLNPKLDVQKMLSKYAGLLTPIELPKRSWFHNRLRWYENSPDKGESMIRNRYGDEFWENEFLIFDSYVQKALIILQHTFIDHAKLKFFLVDEETRSKTYIVWVTVLIDAKSRSVLGFYISEDGPCIESVIGCLKNALWPKTELLEKFGLNDEWPCFGTPASVSFDNAWAHHSLTVEELFRYLKIDLDLRPPYKARYGALIERFLGTLQALIRQFLPGAILSKTPKEAQNAAKKACLLFEDLYKEVLKLIVAYQNTPHSELDGMTPNQMWKIGMKTMYPYAPPKTPELERKFWRLDPGDRVITAKGISAFGLKYTSLALKKLDRVDINGEKIKYRYSYSTDNINRLAIWKDGVWQCDVFANKFHLFDDVYISVSLAQHNLAKKLAMELGESSSNWHDYIHEVRDRVDQRKKEQKQIQRESQQPPMPVKTSSVTEMEDALQAIPSESDMDEYSELAANFNEN